MKYLIGDIEFKYQNGKVIGQIWIHDFYLDVYRKEVPIHNDEEFKKYCTEVYDKVPEYWKEVK